MHGDQQDQRERDRETRKAGNVLGHGTPIAQGNYCNYGIVYII